METGVEKGETKAFWYKDLPSPPMKSGEDPGGTNEGNGQGCEDPRGGIWKGTWKCVSLCYVGDPIEGRRGGRKKKKEKGKKEGKEERKGKKGRRGKNGEKVKEE